MRTLQKAHDVFEMDLGRTRLGAAVVRSTRKWNSKAVEHWQMENNLRPSHLWRAVDSLWRHNMYRDRFALVLWDGNGKTEG